MSQPLPRLGFLGVSASGCCGLAELSSGDIAIPTILWDISAEALTRGLALVPDATLVATPVDLLEADIDGVVIAMPNPLHAGLAMAALQKHLTYGTRPTRSDVAALVRFCLGGARSVARDRKRK